MDSAQEWRKRLVRLERDASSMGTANHARYINDIILAMRDPVFAGDVALNNREAPLRALRVLDAMWGGAFAKRPDQRAALNDVGIWLESRLLGDARVDVKHLLVELGWLGRLSRHQQAMLEDARRPGMGAPGRGDQKSFGKRFAEIERRRRGAFAAMEAEKVEAAKVEPPKPKEAEPLPSTLAVDFEDFNRVREVRKAIAEREKKKKEPREATLVLVGRGGAAAGMRFVCSTTRTAGMAEVMERVRQTPGAPDWHMIASEMVNDEGAAAMFVGRLVVD